MSGPPNLERDPEKMDALSRLIVHDLSEKMPLS